MSLVTIAPGHQLVAAPAASYLRMLTDGCPPGITSSTRTVALQLAYFTHQGEPGWPAQADSPARSKHVYRPGDTDEGGRALDLPRGPAAWVRAHPEHGWRFTIASEWWHTEYFTLLDLHRNAPPATLPAPPAPPAADPWEDDMRELIEALYLVGLGRQVYTNDVGAAGWLVAAAEDAWSPAQLRAEFWKAAAEPGTVRQAFLDFLGHVPTAAQVSSWTGPGMTIGAVRAGIFGSDEARRRRGEIA